MVVRNKENPLAVVLTNSTGSVAGTSGPFTRVHLAAATNAAVATRFLNTTNMANGAYTVANSGTMPTEGGYKLQVTHTTVAGADTLGTITFVGTDLNNAALTEIITPVAGSTALGVSIFKTVTSMTQAGWTAAVALFLQSSRGTPQ